MYKQVMLLGLLLDRPMYGQQIREVLENHHDLLADHLKKPTIYYQLERLAGEGYLEIRHEAVEAPGPGAAHDDLALRERDVYYITAYGRQHFYTLLRGMLGTYTPGLNEVDACLYFLHHLSAEDAKRLLSERLLLMQTYHASTLAQTAEHGQHDPAHQLVHEHKLALLSAEIAWLTQSIAHISTP